jgi:hypothetical protein
MYERHSICICSIMCLPTRKEEYRSTFPRFSEFAEARLRNIPSRCGESTVLGTSTIVDSRRLALSRIEFLNENVICGSKSVLNHRTDSPTTDKFPLFGSNPERNPYHKKMPKNHAFKKNKATIASNQTNNLLELFPTPKSKIFDRGGTFPERNVLPGR